MGTLVEITIFEKDENKAELDIQNVFNEIQRLEGLMSTHIPGSEVSAINQAAGVQSVPVSPEVFEVIERALYWARKTDEALDISVGPVQELWKFDIDHPSPLDKTAFEQKLSKVSYDTIHLENETVFLADQGM